MFTIIVIFIFVVVIVLFFLLFFLFFFFFIVIIFDKLFFRFIVCRIVKNFLFNPSIVYQNLFTFFYYSSFVTDICFAAAPRNMNSWNNFSFFFVFEIWLNRYPMLIPVCFDSSVID